MYIHMIIISMNSIENIRSKIIQEIYYVDLFSFEEKGDEDLIIFDQV